MFKSRPKEAELITSIRSGGQPREWATRQLLERNIYYVKKLSRQFNLPEENVLDAYTDALMLLIDHVATGRFRGESQLSTYLYQILFNKCRDLLKKPSTNTVELNEWTEKWDASSKSFLKDFIDKETVASLKNQFDLLGETCKQVLLDWGYWGYKMEEIAERTGLENGDQAKKRKYKCLQKLRKILAKK